MAKLKDITNNVYGRLTVVGRDFSKKGSGTYWFCKCSCGNPNLISVYKGSLTQGLTNSCGCIRKEVLAQHKINKYDLSNDYGIGICTNTGNEFYFDLEDYDKIKGYCWYENDQGYVVSQQNRKNIRMHRLVMGLKAYNPQEQVDHIHHNKRDNRKAYLRIVNNSQNSMNKSVKGVYWNSEKQKWVANLSHNKIKHFKYFDNFEDAKQQRIKYELQYFKEYAYKECD